MQYASAGVGSFQHLGGELFKLEAGVHTLHVPFKGGGPAMIDVIGGHTEPPFSRRRRPRRISAPASSRRWPWRSKRSQAAGVFQFVAESGVPSYGAVNWWGVVAPAGTPAPIIERAAQGGGGGGRGSPEVQKQFDAEGAEIARMSSAEFGSFMEKETASGAAW